MSAHTRRRCRSRDAVSSRRRSFPTESSSAGDRRRSPSRRCLSFSATATTPARFATSPRQSGMSVGAIFNYFPSKEDILFYLLNVLQGGIEEALARARIDFQRHTTGKGSDPLEAFTEWYDRYARSVYDLRAYLLLGYQEMKSLSREHRHRFLEREREMQSFLAESSLMGSSTASSTARSATLAATLTACSYWRRRGRSGAERSRRLRIFRSTWSFYDGWSCVCSVPQAGKSGDCCPNGERGG